MYQNFIIAFLAVALFFSESGFCKSKWIPMGSIQEDAKRREHLFERYLGNDEKKLYGVHSMYLPEQSLDFPTGVSFAFDGPVDIEFIRELKSRKNDAIRVLIPAMGSGRSVMDALSVHTTAHVYANDLRPSAFSHLKVLIARFGAPSFHERITNLAGDIESEMDELGEHSIDLVYLVNLFHFLSPEKVESAFSKLRTILKPNGKIFIAWRGFPAAGFKPVPVYSERNCKGQFADMITQQKSKLRHPNHVVKNLGPVSDTCIYPYYGATLADMSGHAKTFGFEVIMKGESKMISASVAGFVTFGEYRFEDSFGHPADPEQTYLNHMILTPAKEDL